MQSWQSKMFEQVIWLTGRRKNFLTEEAMNKFIELNHSRPTYKLEDDFMKKHSIALFTSDNMDVYVLNQHSLKDKTIVYFHGGAYINEPLSFHWKYLVKLAKQTGYKIFVPIYPKLPKHHHKHCYEQLEYFYEKTLSKQPNLLFMGDSAGGGLALAFAQKLYSEGKRGPIENILFSPWLDLSNTGEGYEEIEKLDPMVGITGAKILAKLWRDDLDAKHYLVSPLFGSFEGIAKPTIFVGTHELILLDCRKLKERADKEMFQIDYYEFEKMNHVFPLFPIPEANKVWEIVLPKLLGQEYTVQEKSTVQIPIQQLEMT